MTGTTSRRSARRDLGWRTCANGGSVTSRGPTRRGRGTRPGRLVMKRRSDSVLLGNGIDLARFDPARVEPRRLGDLRRELGIPADAPVVGSVGRLVADKGFRELFRAAREVWRAVPNAVF